MMNLGHQFDGRLGTIKPISMKCHKPNIHFYLTKHVFKYLHFNLNYWKRFSYLKRSSLSLSLSCMASCKSVELMNWWRRLSFPLKAFRKMQNSIPWIRCTSNCQTSCCSPGRRRGTRWCQSCRWIWRCRAGCKCTCRCWSPRRWWGKFRRRPRQHWTSKRWPYSSCPRVKSVWPDG